MVQYDDNVRYKGEIDLSAAEVDELFHAVMHQQHRIAKLVEDTHPHAIVSIANERRQQLRNIEHVLITLRRNLTRYHVTEK
jgi:hypothetical protein